MLCYLPIFLLNYDFQILFLNYYLYLLYCYFLICLNYFNFAFLCKVINFVNVLIFWSTIPLNLYHHFLTNLISMIFALKELFRFLLFFFVLMILFSSFFDLYLLIYYSNQLNFYFNSKNLNLYYY